MEEVKQLTIDDRKVIKTGSSTKGNWTLWKVTAGGLGYTTFLDLPVGSTNAFTIESKPSARTDKNGRPFTDRSIIAYAGPVANVQATPARPAPQNFTAPSGQSGPNYATQNDILKIEAKISDLADNLELRIKDLELAEAARNPLNH
jgi:hypothetical protein